MDDLEKTSMFREENLARYRMRFLVILIALNCVLLAVLNIAAQKIIQIGPFALSATGIFYALTFFTTDLISEIWGRKVATFSVIVGFIGSILSVVILQVAIWLPSAEFWGNSESFDLILGAVPRIVIASMIAYLIAQLHDVWAFHFWRAKTKGRHLWFRNIASTFTSQFMDTIIFIGLAFGGVVPTGELIVMMVSQLVFKWLIALADTGPIYWARSMLGGPVPGAHPEDEV